MSERHWNRRSSATNERNYVENNVMGDIDDGHSIAKKLNELGKEEREEGKKDKGERERNDLIDSNETSTQRDVYDSSYQSNKTEDYDNVVLDPGKTLSSTATTTNWGKGKKIRNRANAGGAAAAIAMVAVGAAMLVVGPMVIVLRALDKRRQERRYLKSSRWDDQPPTYEQATLMNEVPRYSTLNLNTVHNSRGPSISSSSSSSRPTATSFERSP